MGLHDDLDDHDDDVSFLLTYFTNTKKIKKIIMNILYNSILIFIFFINNYKYLINILI